MSAFFSKLFTIFCKKLQKVRYLHCVVKFHLRKLGCALTWYKTAVLQLRNCVALQLNQNVHCGSCDVLQYFAMRFYWLKISLCLVALRFRYNVISALLCKLASATLIAMDTL